MELVLISIVLGLLIFWWLQSGPAEIKEAGRRIPGPTPYPIVGNIFNGSLQGTNISSRMDKLLKKYGYTFRVWMGSILNVVVTEPEDMQKILSSQTLLTKGFSYTSLKPWLGTGLLLSTGQLWYLRRKAITPTFHFKILGDFVPTFNKCGRTLVDCLKEKVGKGPFLITDYMSNCALDAVAETAMGTSINAQTNPLSDYVNAVMKMTDLLSRLVNYPFLILEPFYTLSGYRGKSEALLKILFSLPMEILEKKRKEREEMQNTPTKEEIYGSKKKTAFLELLLRMKEDREPAIQSDQDIKDEVMTFMFEGHDTTTMALTFTIWLLGLHPEIQEELYQEVSEVLGSTEPTLEDYSKMKYLDRVIKESMRLYPPVPAVSRTVTEEIVLPTSGYRIPVGAQVSLFFYAMHRRADLFPQPEKFDPDRFLHQQKHPFAYVPFSAGPRNCIGQKFAMLDLKVLISHVVFNYKIRSEKELVLSREFLLRAAKGPYVSLTNRRDSNELKT